MELYNMSVEQFRSYISKQYYKKTRKIVFLGEKMTFEEWNDIWQFINDIHPMVGGTKEAEKVWELFNEAWPRPKGGE